MKQKFSKKKSVRKALTERLLAEQNMTKTKPVPTLNTGGTACFVYESLILLFVFVEEDTVSLVRLLT